MYDVISINFIVFYVNRLDMKLALKPRRQQSPIVLTGRMMEPYLSFYLSNLPKILMASS